MLLSNATIKFSLSLMMILFVQAQTKRASSQNQVQDLIKSNEMHQNVLTQNLPTHHCQTSGDRSVQFSLFQDKPPSVLRPGTS